MMIKISNIKIIETFGFDEKKLDELIKMMEKYGVKNPRNMLPQTPHHVISFKLDNTDSAFANAIRRTLVEEIPTYAMDCEDSAIETDDEKKITDVIIKNINLVPISQDIDYKKVKNISLDVHNKTNDIIDVKASDLEINGESLQNVIPNSNITITTLKPGKFMKIKNISIIRGMSKDNAAKFSLLNGFDYEPLDVEPYDMYSKTGNRSIKSNITSVKMSFTTCGNINPYTLFKLLCDTLSERLENIKRKISVFSDYLKKNPETLYYFNEDFEVKITQNGIYEYKIEGEYISIPNMIARTCYNMDPNLPFCSANIERYDTSADTIKLKHADCNKLMMGAIDICLNNLSIIRKEILACKIEKK